MYRKYEYILIVSDPSEITIIRLKSEIDQFEMLKLGSMRWQ